MDDKLRCGEQLFGSFLRRFVIELDPQHARFMFPVVDDADIFDIDIVEGQSGGHLSQHTGAVVYINVERVHSLDGAAGGVNKGIPVDSGAVKKLYSASS